MTLEEKGSDQLIWKVGHAAAAIQTKQMDKNAPMMDRAEGRYGSHFKGRGVEEAIQSWS